ncbi:hypothetical protein [Methylocystis echinoides]|uniref:Uncharacterized protein n=1 Tax=Methylocystis echinoides TaxID=29468 RepID=A0A9W6GVK8_9HYPH|nr:hypothetical protein [Methylocystis echinoides]GLI93827.1 hypothetical protein LMG27198_28190 [Methylocystis echinoides]
MTKLSVPLLSLCCVIAASHASAATCDGGSGPVPTKTIRIYNNSTGPLNVYVQSPKIEGIKPADADLWMQAACKITSWDPITFISDQRFLTKKLYRAYIEINNASKGIAPNGGYVDINIPFYTQLLTYDSSDLGKVPDQFIDWWNANRVYIFDSPAAYNSAKWTNNLDVPVPAPGGGLPQPDVTYVSGAALPTCASSDGSACTVVLKQAAINVPDNVPFQLQEYTYGSAEGPPLNKNLAPPTYTQWDPAWVNYNVSSLDSVFLPVAMGPLHQNDGQPTKPYVGSVLTVPQFRSVLSSFSSSGNSWPFYIPAYFDSVTHGDFSSSVSRSCALTQPFPASAPPPYQFAAYKLPKLPGTFNLLTESYQGDPGSDAAAPPIPPLLSSNPSDWAVEYKNNHCSLDHVPAFVNPPALGAQGSLMVQLWRWCEDPQSTIYNSDTCKKIRKVETLFEASVTQSPSCGATPYASIPLWQRMRAVYGWVPVRYKTCIGSNLLDAASSKEQFKEYQLDYCSLQYNYLNANLPAGQIFAPFTALTHRPYSTTSTKPGLASSAYAFSIDDALSFMRVPADGVIMSVGGSNGLENRTGVPLPTTINEALKRCEQG